MYKISVVYRKYLTKNRENGQTFIIKLSLTYLRNQQAIIESPRCLKISLFELEEQCNNTIFLKLILLLHILFL